MVIKQTVKFGYLSLLKCVEKYQKKADSSQTRQLTVQWLCYMGKCACVRESRLQVVGRRSAVGDRRACGNSRARVTNVRRRCSRHDAKNATGWRTSDGSGFCRHRFICIYRLKFDNVLCYPYP